jgi:hypothetical protein
MTRCLPRSRRRVRKHPSVPKHRKASGNMNKRLVGIAFSVLVALPASAAAIVWARHAYQRALAQYERALVHQPETIQKTLERIKLPPEFKIRLYALVPGARHVAVGPQGKVIFVGTAETKVYAVTVDASSGAAGKISEFAPAIEMNVPNGVCFAKDGVLYVAEVNRVLSFPRAEEDYHDPSVRAKAKSSKTSSFRSRTRAPS